jgi:hypothetical protein
MVEGVIRHGGICGDFGGSDFGWGFGVVSGYF